MLKTKKVTHLKVICDLLLYLPYFILFCLVWGILDRAPEGIKVSKHNILSQVGGSELEKLAFQFCKHIF